MKKFTATKNDAGQRLDKFLSKLLKDAPMGMIYKWIRKKRVKINGKKQEISYVLCEGDVLELYINDEFFETQKTEIKKGLPVDVVYEDENILVVSKPSGIAAHGEDDGLLERIVGYLFEKGEYDPKREHTFRPALCNRIDKNTSGLVIAAKNAVALRIINEKLKSREIDKFYLMRVEKIPNPPSGRISGYTLKNERERKVYFYEEPVKGAKPAQTIYRALGNSGLVEAQLISGRTHQIRASFSHIGCPLMGDVKYGAKKNGKSDFQQLCAYKLVFSFKTPAGELEYLNNKVIEIKPEI